MATGTAVTGTKSTPIKGKRTPPPSDETEAAKFVRLTQNRMSKALKAVRLCCNLSRYEHTEEQAQRVIAALTSEVDGVQQAFSAPKRNTEVKFTL